MAKLTIDLDALPDDVAAYLDRCGGLAGGHADMKRRAVAAIIEGLRLLEARENAELDAVPVEETEGCSQPSLWDHYRTIEAEIPF
ncbi:hypothetical protein [Roseomonas sp. CECT 9278]|uniref:hypothetical protein n=1 Tax=Roseomonas sp. CECT 9278 TaxID=2845823 RepID=UPI001E51C086|nr:hypothetical protein [Roseomonas sp. CECT 9278]CAH0313463.1 hypothetical protein ROS9278_05035 [Roseomonas sp. CECT 9278]